MEFPFELSAILPDEITKVTSNLAPFKRNHFESVESLRQKLSKIIDAVGVASSHAQGLRGAITTATKLRGSDHHLFICKAANTDEKRNCVIGILRVGKKKLFIVDLHGQQIEVHPLCILDFYVHESKQRSGYGKKLFNHMLSVENIKPEQLAIDRPSSKFLNFLKKHYALKNSFQQLNKFVVFDQFFRDLSAIGYVPSRRRFAASAPVLGRPANGVAGDFRPASVSRFGDHNLSGIQLNRNGKQSDAFNSNSQNSFGDSKLLINKKTNTLPRPTARNEGLLTENSSLQQKAAHGAQSRPLGQQQISAYSRHSYNSPKGKGQYPQPQSPLPLGNEPKETIGSSQAVTNPHFNVLRPLQDTSRKNLREASTDNPFSLRIGSRESAARLDFVGNGPKSNSENSVGIGSTGNYSVDGVFGQGNARRPVLGTSWNVFGVPSSIDHRDNNPYTRTRKNNFSR